MKTAYIPEPQPQFGPIEISAFYYPGTEQMSEWDQLEQTLPECKPLLGWYDEGNPEVVDWQIKWAVEHGISSFCVDWYWNRGVQRLDHWVKAYYKAKFRRYLKWYMMLCNHNEPGSHSSEDQRNLTRFWIDNYFKTPEYYTIDGKPVVVIWSVEDLDRDFIDEAARMGETLEPGEGAKKAFGISQSMAKEAGLPGIYFISMCKGRLFDLETIKFGEKTGCSNTVFYNLDLRSYPLASEFQHPGDDETRFHYDCVVNGMPRWWQKCLDHPEHPTIPLVSTGYDDRPRKLNHRIMAYGRNPDRFREICLACKEMCEKHGIRKIMLAPLNEWQEGTYIEPNHEFGFGYYNVLREVFCPEPENGFPEDLTPEDVGRGPYDYPPMERLKLTSWDFKNGFSGWYRNPFGTAHLQIKNDALFFAKSWAILPALRTRISPFDAKQFKKFKVLMKLEPNERGELSGNPELTLFWGTAENPLITPELNFNETCKKSVPVFPDNEWHEYVIDLQDNANWFGMINELWINPIPMSHAIVQIQKMSFE